jgi:hypothetical protein
LKNFSPDLTVAAQLSPLHFAANNFSTNLYLLYYLLHFPCLTAQIFLLLFCLDDVICFNYLIAWCLPWRITQDRVELEAISIHCF